MEFGNLIIIKEKGCWIKTWKWNLSFVCLPSCYSYRLATFIIMHILSSVNLKEHPQSPTNLWQLLPTIYSTCRPYLATTYCLQQLFTFCKPQTQYNYLLIIFHGNHPLVIGLLSYSSNKYKKYFNCKEKKEPT